MNKSIGIHYRWYTQIKIDNDYFWILSVEIELNTINQFLIYLSFTCRKKHVCCTEFYSKSGKQIRKASSFYRYDSGTWYPYACKFLNWDIIFILLFRKASLKDLSSTLRTEKNVLMTSILADTHKPLWDISHLYKWARLFMFMRNAGIIILNLPYNFRLRTS